MHNTYHFLKHLIPELDKKLNESLLTECFSQSKDELILEFKHIKKQSRFYIKAHLKSNFSCLSFPEEFNRARKNSVSLFQSVIGREVTEIKLYKNERSFSIQFTNNQSLLFKLHGNRSNIIRIENGNIAELFRNALRKDILINTNELNRALDTSYKQLRKNDWDVRKTIPTLDRRTADILFNKLSESSHKEATYESFLEELDSPEIYVFKDEINYHLTLIKPEGAYELFNNPIEAINYFFDKQIRHQTLSTIKSSILSNLNNQLVKTGNYVIKSKQKLSSLSKGASNQHIADVIMANLHTIEKGAGRVTLFNFYNGEDITIKLNPQLSAQKNAERFYRKAKNEAKEIAILEQNISTREEQLLKLEKDIQEVQEATSVKELKHWQGVSKVSSTEPNLPYKEFIMDGFRILVGKNAKQNDELTLKIAKKDDLWLHAKDVAGSHVVIKQVPGTNYPQYIIEKAAQLAAYYSKRKTDTLCPVLYTQKKFVRKSKGAPAGSMIVEKEKVMLVEPSPNP